ncbi:hypothetical protein ACP4OV_031512 [Aristida adscensionis]
MDADADATKPRGGGGGGGGGEATSALPHLDDGVVAEILHRLPTRDAYRASAVCPRWRAVVSEPVFLSRHLSPPPLPLLHDGPPLVILQPRRRVGYTHLTLVATDPAAAGIVGLDLPLEPKYTDKSRKPVYVEPKPYSTGDDTTEICDDDDDEAPEAAEAEAPPGAEAAPPLRPEVPDHVAFFERTVPMLDVSFVAAHGRLLLARSKSRYYVCDPGANRWLVLPPSPLPPTYDAAPGLHYDLDAATGRVSFTVVLLIRARQRQLIVETFSSATGRWERVVLDAQGAARRLGVASPGIHVGASFYWLSRRGARVIRYNLARRRASVVREPPEAEGSKGRLCRSLGSAGGRLRFCAFDVRDEHSGNMLPHDGLEGVHGVWVMDDDGGAGAWRRVHEAVVENLSAWYFNVVTGVEHAVEFAGACGGAIVVKRNHRVVRYDLESGDKAVLASLYRDDGNLAELYSRYTAFPFYGSG